ncbi:MAG: MBL fold metallo-hydrolase [Nitrospinae bacterium]|nr:MBL fold metallo-hydrolase [Nitrospinota bacterium]
MTSPRLTFLGTGTSSGVPVIGCDCAVCRSADPRDNRTRSSVAVTKGGTTILIDTATDLRAQAIRHTIDRVDAVFYTHHHADHVHGIDDLRIYNFRQKEAIPCYGREETLAFIRTMFPYIFDGRSPEGGGVPSLTLLPLAGPVTVGPLTVIPIPVRHGSLTIDAFRINETAYVTDCSGFPESSLPLLEGLDTLILGTLGLQSHPTHFTLDRALEAIERIAPKRVWLTHLDHTLGHVATEARLPEHIRLAWDGLNLDL